MPVRRSAGGAQCRWGAVPVGPLGFVFSTRPPARHLCREDVDDARGDVRLGVLSQRASRPDLAPLDRAHSRAARQDDLARPFAVEAVPGLAGPLHSPRHHLTSRRDDEELPLLARRLRAPLGRIAECCVLISEVARHHQKRTVRGVPFKVDLPRKVEAPRGHGV